MKLAKRILLLAVLFPTLGVSLPGMTRKVPGITVRFYVEANKQDGETFSTPVTLKNPPRQAYVEKIPAVSERSFRAIYPFRAADGTWGCGFKLDDKGRLDLETVSSSKRGMDVVPLVGTKLGSHQLTEMVVDRTISDGIISIPSGLTDLEIDELRKAFPVIGEAPRKRK